MEKKQLDFNAPLLSVRRLSSTSSISDVMNGKVTEKSIPNRQHYLPLYKSDWELEEVTKPAGVPFLWERIPGRAKDGKKPLEEPSNSPRTTPGRLLDIIKHISEEEIEHLNVNEDLNLENGEDVYSDALETLSPTESFSWHCSESSLNRFDNPDIKSSRTFSTDPQTRDYLMSRFLPAAKAMILETPQYVSKKKNPVPELPKQVKKVYSGELRPLLEQYRFNTISSYDQYKRDAENEEEYDEHDGTEKKLGKACGFFPRFCVKSSLGLLNPVPGLKSKTQTQTLVSSAGEIRRLARTSYGGPLTPTVEKHNSNAVYRKRPVFQSKEVHEIENKLTDKSNRFYHSSDSFMTDASSAYGGSRGDRISPYRNETPQSPFCDGARFLGIPKEVQNVEAKFFSSINKRYDISPHQLGHQGSSTVSLIAEKTLYVDSVNIVQTQRNLVSSKAEGPLKSSDETLLECGVMEEDKKGSNHIKGGTILKPKAFGSVDADMISSDCILSLRGRSEGSKVDRDIEQEVRSLECSKVDSNGNLDNTIKEGGDRNSGVGTLQSPRAPPLPKSPSESWLWRTISLRNPFPKNQGQKTSTTGAKWETIVKTSNVHHDHIRYSEELLHVSQHSKT